ncbi:MAG: hypothetical protein ACI8UP_005076, partial [Porticoccaceae bacterium]
LVWDLVIHFLSVHLDQTRKSDHLEMQPDQDYVFVSFLPVHYEEILSCL